MFCSCATNCANKRCGCRKAGLRCSNFCSNCNGISCSNASLISSRSGNLQDAENEGSGKDTAGDVHDDVHNSGFINQDDINDLEENDVNNENLDCHDDNDDENSDTDDELREQENYERERRYLTLKEVLIEQDSDEELNNTESREMDFETF